MLLLENSWEAQPAPVGTWILRLHNLGDRPLRDFSLSLTSVVRVMNDHFVHNGRLVRRQANYHEVLPPEGLAVAPGQTWTFQIEGLFFAPTHRNELAKTAWVMLADGTRMPCAVADVAHAETAPKPPPPRLPEGKLTLPFALVPWPNRIDAVPGPVPALLSLAEGTALEDQRLALSVAALHRRLFPTAPFLFQRTAVPGARPLHFAHDASLPAEGFRLTFGEAVTLTAGTTAGRRHGLMALAQMLHGAQTDTAFRFPASGVIEDAPRLEWRACHLDCARHFFTFAQVLRMVDVLAWLRMNVFHWHLTDDEAWRAEIRAFPELTTTGVTRAPDLPLMLPQAGTVEGSRDYYTQDQMRAVVAHAAALGIEVMPEIETPGHAACVMAALPYLVDPDETPDSYQSVQGFPNNAWNPAIPETYSVLETIIDEICGIFPSKYFHIGGDEVAKNAWMESPRARVLMQREGLSTTFELQSWFLRRIKKMLDARGKILVGWNEVSEGGGVPPENTLLMAWMSPEFGTDLARQGYDVVMTPAQAYYLDIAQSPDWQEIGNSWAGAASLEQSYTYEAASAFPPELAHHMKGIQACIWCEYFTGDAWFNHMVFPRLLAVAEAGWTLPENKDWQRFAAQARLHPTL